MDDKKFQKLIAKVEEMKKSGTFDLSMEEDLSIAVMNLISLEEHFFFTAEKTKDPSYFDLLSETREIRKEVMSRMIDKHEGETWCITKHLLATTMRLIEVGTKLKSQNDPKAKETFDMAYKTYSLFWALRLKLISVTDVMKKKEKTPMTYEDIVGKLVDCCKE